VSACPKAGLPSEGAKRRPRRQHAAKPQRGATHYDPCAGQQAEKAYDEAIAPNLKAGKTLMFAHGFNIRFGAIKPPTRMLTSQWSLPKLPAIVYAKCSPKVADARTSRRRTERLRPKRKNSALSYARGIGCTRAGVLETTFTEETETDLFGEQAVLCGGVSELIKAGLRNAHERRLSARSRLFRMSARTETHRRSDLPRRPQLYALFHQ